MAGSYWIKWQTSKWLTDPELSNCSPATRGIWADLLNRIYEVDGDGSITGTVRSLSQQSRCQVNELEAAIEELDLFGVCEIEYIADTDLIKITSRHARRYLEKKRADRERKRASREEEENVTENVTDGDGHSSDKARTTNGQTKENTRTSRARASKDSISSSSSNSTGKGKGGVGEKGKPTYVSRSPPSLSEVKEYFAERDAPGEEAEKFVDHFQSQGWKLANGNPMKDWQASVRNWVRRMPEFAKARGSPGSLMTYHEARQDWEKRGKPGSKFPGASYEAVPQEGKDKPLWRRAV